jgi:hypothetical protein
MRRIFPRDAGSLERAINHLDRLAGWMNTFLMVAVIGLVILNLAAPINLVDLKRLPITRISSATPAVQPATSIGNPIPPR